MDKELLYGKFLESEGVSTDTRQIKSGSIFFALKGPNFNANSFSAEALRKGARFAVVDEVQFADDPRIILVEDALTALQQLARHHRNQLRIPVVGLTGSNGKTTTKELLHAVLTKKFKTQATRGNLNNHIGVPLTILALTQATEIGVVEMGANHVGEIALLCDIAKPTHGLITNIGRAHIGTFGGFENIVRAKSELYQYLIAHEGQAFINSRSPELLAQRKHFKSPWIYPAAGDTYHCELISADPYIRLKTDDGADISTHLIGGYNFENVAAALCVGKYFGVESGMANRAVSEYEPQAMRSQVISSGSNLIILDAYNANPSSMEAAIENLARMKAPKKVAILGDMYELEDQSDLEHRKLGALLHEKGIKEVYLCGKLIRTALDTCPEAKYFAGKNELIDFIKSNPVRDATILVKASRGMGLETVVDALK